MSLIATIRQFLININITKNIANYKFKNFKLILFIITITINISCNSKNNIDKFSVNIDSLKILPDNFYGYRRGRIYLTDLKTEGYSVWFDLDDSGDIENIFRIDDFKTPKSDIATTIKTYGIDTFSIKKQAQKFIYLSRKYKFGHISIDRRSKIYFSYKDGLAEQYVKPLNDSVKNVYLKDKNFKLLENGWFESLKE